MEICFKNIVYQSEGSGPLVLCLHGYGEDHTFWDVLVEAGKSTYSFVCPDFPGFGKSSMIAKNLTELAQLLFEIPQVYDAKKIVVLGHSMGGYIALEMLQLKPDKLAGIGLINSHVFGDDPAKLELRRKSVDLMESGGTERFIKEMYANLFCDKFKSEQTADYDRLRSAALGFDKQAYMHYYKAMMVRSNRFNLLGSDLPWLFISGSSDPLISLDLCLKQMVQPKAASVHVLEDCAHMSLHENPEESTHAILKYLKGLSVLRSPFI